MAQFEILMPKLGESVEEATIIKWLISEGSAVKEDDMLLSIATDKVDSEIPSPVAGTVAKLLYKEGDKIAVGKVIALINLEGSEPAPKENTSAPAKTEQKAQNEAPAAQNTASAGSVADINETSDRFYSPLVKSIAKEENLSVEELEKIQGTGRDGRVTKQDVINYLGNRKSGGQKPAQPQQPAKTEAPAVVHQQQPAVVSEKPKASIPVGPEDEVVEMDRMRKIIADHMIMSKQTSPHVTNIVEADVTNLVLWRDKIKDAFQAREKEKITFMPIFIEATARALKEYPMVNASVDGTKIILRKNINIGVAVALPTGNLIVPVIKKADQLNLVGLTKEMNRLANTARANKLGPDDIAGGTFSISNFGSFRNLMGTPVINQPQVAILATGNIEKKPSVIETPTGDVIAIRHKMYLSLSYDHRIVDGALGGGFLRRIADILEQFDVNRAF